MNIIEQFSAREAGGVIQFIKYGIGGCIATVTHIIMFHLAAWKLFPALEKTDFAVKFLKLTVTKLDAALRSRNAMIDNVIAFAFSCAVAYFIDIYWVFEPGRYCFFVELGLFYLVSGISIAIGTALMGFLIRRYGIQTTYAFMANIITSVMINYVSRKFFIFKG